MRFNEAPALQRTDQSIMQLNSVPAFLSIDVEPDAFQLSRDEVPAWTGFDAMAPFIESLRTSILK